MSIHIVSTLLLCYVLIVTSPETTAQPFIDFSKAKIEYVSELNTSEDEYAPVFSPSGEIFVFVSNREGSTLTSLDYNKNGLPLPRKNSHDIWRANFVADTFQAPVPWKMLNTPLNEGAISFGKNLGVFYYTRCNTADGFGDCDLYQCTFFDTVWVINNLGKNVNNEGWQSQSAYAKGGSIFFASNTPTSYDLRNNITNFDIFFSQYDSTTKAFQPYERLENINTKDKESTPFYSFFDDALYFASEGHSPNYGGLDLYRSKRNPDGTWQDPENLGKHINSQYDDFFMTISRDGKHIYFTSNRRDNNNEKDLDFYKIVLP